MITIAKKAKKILRSLKTPIIIETKKLKPLKILKKKLIFKKPVMIIRHSRIQIGIYPSILVNFKRA